MPKNFARQALDKRRLGDAVDLFTNIQMVEHGDSKDILGNTYEYCLSKFAEQEGLLANSIPLPAWSKRWWRFCSPTMAGYTKLRRKI